MMKPSEFQTTIENQFDYICKVAMEDERKDYLKALSRQCKRETLFCDMDDYTVNLFSSEDTYPSHFHTFEMDGFTVRIENSLLAYVDFAEPQVDPQTGTFSVRAEMPNPKQVLLPGQFTKVKLLLDVREGALVVPMKAVTIEKGGAYIYTMRRDNAVEKRFIELGPEVGNNVVVERDRKSTRLNSSH